ncbi:hypothetical protein MCOR27_005826 [Pyricularia oryzae]|uniref:SH3 domain-containing protein n=2 Tax=Pyricularia TaxID=48558 RepID=A0ABQ8N8V8_PYRGI|nr:hypothetical protein MCOR01_008408 [Pyricularia oryzae]KAI6293170.1 hypothetical protein MCOR33_009343 [Pyricularia grisea]KAI6277932.1 hypothetical protein MCOR27_005826 [Pyricularia oryzae]KAI6306096.1 hypothetical protein MCOR29_010242 [Pyricularia oryzae]KAI6337009.1 hypothetical protein MCOR28_008811 [Pyricularia oryzae]
MRSRLRKSAIMEEAAKELVLSPFREIVTKGTTALENARGAEDSDVKVSMTKAANALLREGDRAVKKIEPLCDKLLANQGDIFIDALRENDEIAEYRSELSDLLWEFDDFIEPDGFDEDRFTELRSLSRICAPRVVDILMRMRLEPTSPLTENAAGHLATPTTDQVASMGFTATPLTDMEFDFGFRDTAARPVEPPPCPVRSPWRVATRSSTGQAVTLNTEFSLDDPIPSLQISHSGSSGICTGALEQPLPSPSTRREGHEHEIEEESGRSSAMPLPLRMIKTTAESPGCCCSGDSSDITVSSPTATSTNRSLLSSLSSDAGKSSLRHSRDSSVAESQSSYVIERRDSACEPVSPLTPSFRTPVLAVPPDGYFVPSTAPPLSPLSERDPSDVSSQDESQVSEPIEVDSSLIPVEPEKTQRTLILQPSRIPDCSIGPQSSFHRMRGFCEGAKDTLAGHDGFRQVKKLNFGGSSILASKCKTCLYELDWEEVEADRKGLPKAKLFSKTSGVGFRLRFLAKSHMPAKSVDDQVYACIFCEQLGRTTEETDATVFFSQKQLFAHISRHARPLPSIPGLIVIEEAEVPTVFEDNYDLHLPNPPKLSKLAEDKSLAMQVELLPVATSVMTVKQSYGTLKMPPDRATPLQFAVGTRIFGVEFPEQYGGEWAVGWSDNVHACFPADTVKLEPPPKSQMALGGIISNRRAVARWKFSIKGKERGEWLKFDKGEIITDIGWVHPGHWCWSGVNAKGKWGIFPRSHIEVSTLKEGEGAEDQASTSSGSTGHKKPASLFTRVSMRVRAGSSSSSGSKVRPSLY